ncbi:MAG TPA: hypothetical protein VN478_03305, partial [Clostridia bacterium]|nr:hypothetical protein [Clostridia bacterium]
MKKFLAIVLVIGLVVGVMGPIARVSAADQSTTTPPDGWSSSGVHPVIETLLPSGVPVLVLEDAYPWGSTSHITLLASLGYAPHMATWSDLGVSVNLSDFKNVYVASDQPQSFYDGYAAHAAELTAWVQAGGHLVFSACNQGFAGGSITTPLPGGFVQAHRYATTNVVADSAHPIATGILSNGVPLASPLTGTYASHSYFSVLPELADVIIRDDSHGATLAEYPLGAGLVIASGLTWEIAYELGWTFATSAYDDLFLYAFPKTKHMIAATAGTGGSISPSGDVTVYEGSSRT